MVRIHCKKTDEHQFLFDSTVQENVDVLTRELAQLHNMRLKTKRLVDEGKQLAQYGPMKNPDEQGLEGEREERFTEVSEANNAPHGPNYRKDPSERRTGDAPLAEMAAVLMRTLEDAEAIIHKDNVDRKRAITMKEMADAIETVRGAVMILYPMGLPEWDSVRNILENTEELEGTQQGTEILDPDNCALWWANKELAREKKLLDYVGKNEKTKIVAKLQRKGAHAPQREPVVSAAEQKEMMAHYHRKQEEQKKLAEQNDDDYMNSAWANPKALKGSLVGGGRDISWRPN